MGGAGWDGLSAPQYPSLFRLGQHPLEEIYALAKVADFHPLRVDLVEQKLQALTLEFEALPRIVGFYPTQDASAVGVPPATSRNQDEVVEPPQSHPAERSQLQESRYELSRIESVGSGKP